MKKIVAFGYELQLCNNKSNYKLWNYKIVDVWNYKVTKYKLNYIIFLVEVPLPGQASASISHF